MVRSFAMCGLHAGDIVQNAYGYGLFTGGLGAHYGAEGLGATVIPISGGNTDRQIMVMRDFGVTAVCCTPSYFLHLIERAGQLGVDIRELPVRAGVFGAEPWTASMRKRIESAAGIQAFDIYGLSEVIGPGVAVECPHQDGLHIFEDHFYPEIVDPETGSVLPEGEEGELVLTTLSKQAMPMIRYRTRDITALIPGVCPCGRSLRRMRRIGRRSDDMLIVRGVNVFPSQVEAALLEVEGTLPHYQIILTCQHGPGSDRGAGGSDSGDVQRPDRRARTAEPEDLGRARARAGYPRPGDAGRTSHHSTQRRKGPASDRPANGAAMKLHQLSVFSENKPGHVIAPCRLLAREGIDIRALSLADTERFGILRMIVSDWGRAKDLLEQAGSVVKVTEVLAVEVPDRPGGLADVLEAFIGTAINIEYMYAFPFVRGEKAVLIFRFDQPDAAIARLQERGFQVLSSGALEER